MMNITYSILLMSALCSVTCGAYASSTKLSDSAIEAVEKAALSTDEKKKQRQAIAVMLAEYEIAGKKLLDGLEKNAGKSEIDQQANALLASGEKIMDWGRFRLAQCDAYLEKSLELKAKLGEISQDTLERDYHHDGALPKAPPECYHIKDTFVHPATVLVLTRNDPALGEETVAGIRMEILEVLGHTEVVRQLIVY